MAVCTTSRCVSSAECFPTGIRAPSITSQSLLSQFIVICFGIIILFLSATADGIEFPYAFAVDHLACEEALAENECKTAVVKPPSIVARRTVNGCGYYRQEEGPINNRWFEKCDPVFISGYARVCDTDQDNAQSCGLIDEELNIIIPIVYDEIRLVANVPIVAVKYRNKWGYFSLSEKRLLFTPQFSHVSDFNDGMAYVIDEDEQVSEPAWFIDDKGLRIAPVDRSIKVSGHFSDGLIPAEIDFRWGYLNSQGRWAIDPQFLAAESFANGIAAVQYGSDPDKWAVINPSGAGLIFFEGLSHQLTLAGGLRAQLSIGCEIPDLNRFETGGLPTSSELIGSAANSKCYQLCFNPLEQALAEVCKASE